MQIVHDSHEIHMEKILKNFNKYKEAIKTAKAREELDKICEEINQLRMKEELTQKQFDFLVTKLGRKYYALAKKEEA